MQKIGLHATEELNAVEPANLPLDEAFEIYHQAPMAGFAYELASVELPGELWDQVFAQDEQQTSAIYAEAATPSPAPEEAGVSPIISVDKFKLEAARNPESSFVRLLRPYLSRVRALGYDYLVLVN